MVVSVAVGTAVFVLVLAETGVLVRVAVGCTGVGATAWVEARLDGLKRARERVGGRGLAGGEELPQGLLRDVGGAQRLGGNGALHDAAAGSGPTRARGPADTVTTRS